MRYCLPFLLGLLSFQSLSADWQGLLNQRPAGSQVALIVKPLGQGHLSIEHNADLLLPPASTQKLFTALAAELTLGDDFRFDTRLEGRGQRVSGAWQGDLRLVFSGAPDLSRAQLVEMLQALKGQGIGKISGDLILDGSAFGGYERGPGWPWDNLGVCYSAPASSLTLAHNCVAASLSVQKPGEAARFYVPPFQPVQVSSEVEVVSPSQQQQSLCQLELQRGPQNHYQLSGCVTDEREVWPLNFAVNDTSAYISDVLKDELKRNGIHLGGQIKRQDGANGHWLPLAVVHSKALPKLLEHMLRASDNLYADNFAKTLGRAPGQPGSFALGVRAVKKALAEHLGLSLQPATLVDGSGLSRDNLVSARELAGALQYLASHPQLAVYQGLPVAGVSGTLKFRHSLTRPPLKGNIKAKSGTLNGTSNLAGFFTGASGERYLFVLMSASLSLGDDSEAAKDTMTRYERALLEGLYQAG
ncbi:MAG: D-alanyl-D-alanine carboxypeptidase/D-alanyl-D-alanine-endopeptidase [Pseudomonadota bacterium]|uniref:D-alanyl-D-alanine carboxypeptidase/D-alanyl-D-alanine endopeptidase n=1 Tax=Gallaecimonas pentaromativorans TaxID=584787 RepID=UPI00067F7067|nr:D-alanyl-D-alanine carboxypeptidase/D-alanyl-D-alanine-endopeptidase [Gallaecimonas pentaromativorans]MED5525926.1 D-alanyl-D-alanine carboxypeptidase/D-alanyl-D-alanine-endopeptidase [Pseudomonadota bacterium]